MRVAYHIGKHWPWFRRWYHKRTGSWWWGLSEFVREIPWKNTSRPMSHDEFNEHLEELWRMR